MTKLLLMCLCMSDGISDTVSQNNSDTSNIIVPQKTNKNKYTFTQAAYSTLKYTGYACVALLFCGAITFINNSRKNEIHQLKRRIEYLENTLERATKFSVKVCYLEDPVIPYNQGKFASNLRICRSSELVDNATPYLATSIYVDQMISYTDEAKYLKAFLYQYPSITLTTANFALLENHLKQVCKEGVAEKLLSNSNIIPAGVDKSRIEFNLFAHILIALMIRNMKGNKNDDLFKIMLYACRALCPHELNKDSTNPFSAEQIKEELLKPECINTSIWMLPAEFQILNHTVIK